MGDRHEQWDAIVPQEAEIFGQVRFEPLIQPRGRVGEGSKYIVTQLESIGRRAMSEQSGAGPFGLLPLAQERRVKRAKQCSSLTSEAFVISDDQESRRGTSHTGDKQVTQGRLSWLLGDVIDAPHDSVPGAIRQSVGPLDESSYGYGFCAASCVSKRSRSASGMP